MALILGMDIGGVNIDAVLFDGEKGGVISRVKTLHTGTLGQTMGACLEQLSLETWRTIDEAVLVSTLPGEGQQEAAALSQALAAAGADCPVLLFAGREAAALDSCCGASLLGALGLTGEENCYVVDIGGAAVKMGRITDGQPVFEGGPAFSLPSAGDSRICLSATGDISFGPGRVLPLSRAAGKYEGLFPALSAGRAALLPLLQTGYPFALLADDEAAPSFLAAGTGPQTVSALAAAGTLPDLSALETLIADGIVTAIALTPTDLFHVNGGYVADSREAAYLGVSLLGELCDLSPLAFMQWSLDQLGECLRGGLAAACPGFYGEEKRPLVAVGAAAGTWLRFLSLGGGGKVILPPCAEVAGAVGAAIV